MSNRLLYVEERSVQRFIPRLDELTPKWVVVAARGRAARELKARPQRYELVGTACRQDRTVAFRRLR